MSIARFCEISPPTYSIFGAKLSYFSFKAEPEKHQIVYKQLRKPGQPIGREHCRAVFKPKSDQSILIVLAAGHPTMSFEYRVVPVIKNRTPKANPILLN
ncbi:hypothetical protein RRG08_052659 [Elysia crispata]|uniref:Uncharacterized protein n=1 Tax=Elysia crispata TaxID=231223 RepID=A0AAE1DNK8_9GAST|nr:hypothetical protein RRG08_052659 [Elysia crispata]